MIDKDTVWDIRPPEDRESVYIDDIEFSQSNVGGTIYIAPRKLTRWMRFWYWITFRKPRVYPTGYYQITSVTSGSTCGPNPYMSENNSGEGK
ncbi:MAG: hypothetical protein V4563_17775 [Pseudomonadota bacterium]